MAGKLPADTPRLTPHLFYDDVGAATDWLVNAFGFGVRLKMTDPNGLVVHSELLVGDALVMLGLTGENPAWECPRTLGGKISQRLYIYVEDVDEHYARAMGAGATIHRHLEEHFYGDKVYECIDLEGHRWKFAQRVADVDQTTLTRPEWETTA